MESSDNKTPARPATGRPSLLNSEHRAPSDTGTTTRMLSSLERSERAPGPATTGHSGSRKKYGIAVLALLLLGGVGAFVALQPSSDSSSSMASTAATRVVAVAPAASDAAASAASAAVAVASAASAQIELASASAMPVAIPALAASGTATDVAAASRPASNPLDKLALNDNEVPDAASSAKANAKAPPPAKSRVKTAAAPKPSAAESKAAQARKGKKPEDDADAELVAAMINRLDRRGAKPASTVPPPAAAKPSDLVPANLAELVRECSSKSDLLEARQCRNRVCEKHWGKADACPASRAPKTSSADGLVNQDRRG